MELNHSNLVLKLCKLMEALIFINNVFINSVYINNLSNIPKQLINIIEYIDKNLTGDLSLESLGDRFYINKNYLCTMFSRHIGKSIHQYIIYKRISYAKQLLKGGNNVTETCYLSGFNDYSNFIKTFKKITHETPGRYKNKM